jgi:phosphatidylserine/phosphatidylglycerophosphate/cardiolipin synthase-like enzyme
MRSVLSIVLALCLSSCAGQPPKKDHQLIERRASKSSYNSCFSSDEACDEKLIHFIRSAKKSLDIAIFHLTHPEIVHEILVVFRRVPVRIIVDRKQAKQDFSLVDSLVKAGVEVRMGRQRGIMHHKFVIVDGEFLETGSFNFTLGAAFKNQENQVYLTDPEIVERFKDHFEKMWNDSFRI